MSTVGAAPTPAGPASRATGGPQGSGGVTLPRVLRSEWTKLWSLRSTRWSLAAGMLALLLGVIVAIFDMSRWSELPADTRTHYHGVDNALVGWHLAQLAVGVLGVLVITGEYSTGMIRSTFMAVPRRLPVLWSKVLVFATVVFILSLPITFIGFFATGAVLSQHNVAPSLSTPAALRCVIGVPLILTVLAVFTVALGALIRNTAGAIATFAGIMFVIPGIVGVLSTSIRDAINPYLPSNAINALVTAIRDPADHLLSPWGGFACLCVWAAVLLAAAAVLVVRRDT